MALTRTHRYEGGMQPDQIRDAVSRVRMSFERQDEDLIVDLSLEPGGELPAHYHPLQEERWWVVEGRAGVRLRDDVLEVTPADGESSSPRAWCTGSRASATGRRTFAAM